MKNLAGNKNADSYIKNELKRAGINIEKIEFCANSEVPYNLVGKLNASDLISGFDIKFYRAWYYWIVEGMVPLKLAKQLYNHPEGKQSIRVSGHCCRPPPEAPWIQWINIRQNESVPFITSYHIDDQAGLLLFAEILKGNIR